MNEVFNVIRRIGGGNLDGVSNEVILALMVVGGLLIIASILAGIISIFLAIAYIKYNRKQNSIDKTGEEIARAILDRSGLSHIKVSQSGSMLFGNSYSHFFKKVRLRRLTWKKKSVTALAMAAQKSSLAVLDLEKDPDMKKRVRLTPLIYFGPLAFVPLIVVGVLIDMFVLKVNNGTFTVLMAILGLVFYLISFIMSILVLKTEKKAQEKALQLMRDDGIATSEELNMCKKLFRLYNIEYVNNMVIALLELIYRVLQIVAYVQNSSSSNSKQS